jgi:hypothetical protein
MPFSNNPIKVFISDDFPLGRDIQLDGDLDLQVWRVVRFVAPNIDFLMFNNSSDPRHGKCCLGVGAKDFPEKNREFDQLACTCGCQSLAPSYLSTHLVPIKEGVHHACCRF